jgi:hypothetical protein
MAKFFRKLGDDIKHSFTDTHPQAYKNVANNLVSSSMPQDILLGGYSGVAKRDNSKFYNKSNDIILQGAVDLKIAGASESQKYQKYREQATQKIGQLGKGRNPSTQPTTPAPAPTPTPTPTPTIKKFDSSHILNGLQASGQSPRPTRPSGTDVPAFGIVINPTPKPEQRPIYRPAVMPPENPNKNPNIRPLVRPVTGITPVFHTSQ